MGNLARQKRRRRLARAVASMVKPMASSPPARAPMVPSALARAPLPLVEVTPPRELRGAVDRALLADPAVNAYLKAYRLGECTVLVTREFGIWHLSIAHHARYPTWDEIAEAWYRAIPDAATIAGALILPPLHEYINVHSFCMQVHQIRREEGRS